MAKNSKAGSGWLVVALCFMVILAAAPFLIQADKKFDVVYSAEHERPGFETAPETIRVYASPNVKWDEVSGTRKLIYYLCIVAVGVVCFAQARGVQTGKGYGGQVSLAVPIILALYIGISGYSASLDSGSLVMGFTDFVNQFKIPADVAERVQSGEVRFIKDTNGLLSAHFAAQ
jgi:hypothetical protein